MTIRQGDRVRVHDDVHKYGGRTGVVLRKVESKVNMAAVRLDGRNGDMPVAFFLRELRVEEE